MTYHRVCNKNRTGVATGAGTAYPSRSPVFTPVLSGIRAARSLVFYAMFCGSLFVLLFLILWALCCLFFDIWLLITPLVCSNFSYIVRVMMMLALYYTNTFNWIFFIAFVH